MTHFRHCDRGRAHCWRERGKRANHYHNPEPVESRTVVTTEPLQLTPVQRRTIYRTNVSERVTPAWPTVEYCVGTRVPESVQLYAVPQEAAVEVPEINAYKYMVVNDRVVLIDPAPSEVVVEVAD